MGPSRDLPGLHRGQRKLPRPLTLSPFGLVCHIAQQEVKKRIIIPPNQDTIYIYLWIFIFLRHIVIVLQFLDYNKWDD